METITAEGLKELLDRGSDITLLDVREPWEFDLCHIPDSVNVPMSEIVASLDTLDQNRETVVICHHGARSLQVAGYLEGAGFRRIANLEGGIAAWSSRIDPDMPEY